MSEQARSRKPPKRISKRRLKNIAKHYIARYGASETRLHEVLSRRVARAAEHYPESRAEWLAFVQPVIDELTEGGALDEVRDAKQRALSDHYAGRPLRMVRMRLRQKGFGAIAIEEAMAELPRQVARLSFKRAHDGSDAVSTSELDWLAICRYARRRGFGPYARPGRKEKTREQQLGSLVRAGFAYALAQRLLDASEDEVES